MAAHKERRRDVGRSSGPLRRAASGRVRREPSAPLAPAPIIDDGPTPLHGAAIDAAPIIAAEDNPLSPNLIGAHVPEGALRFTGARRRMGGGAGLVASLLLHGCGVALAAWFIAAAPPALEAGGEEAIPVEVVIAGSEDSAATKEGARPSEVQVTVPLPPEAEVKVALPEVALPPPEAPPPVEVTLPAVDVAPPDAPPPVQLVLPQVAVPPTETPAPVQIDLPSVDLPPPSPPSEVEFALPAVNVPPPEVPPPVVIAAAPPPVAEAKLEEAKPVQPKPVESKPQPDKPRAVAKPVEKPKPQPRVKPTPPQPRQVAARPPAEKPAPRRAEAPKPEAKPAPAAQGRGDAGAGDSDRTRNASTRGGGQPGAGGGAAAAANYKSQVFAHLTRFKTYPEQARERGVTGRPVVAFSLSRSGQVVSASLAGSSGVAMLDSATLAMVRRASPFPTPPPGAQLSFTIPINYNLR